MTDTPIRPKFAVWLYERAISHVEAAEALQKTQQYVSLLCKPFSDPGRRTPSLGLALDIQRYTGGDVAPGDWEAPTVQQSEAAA